MPFNFPANYPEPREHAPSAIMHIAIRQGWATRAEQN